METLREERPVVRKPAMPLPASYVRFSRTPVFDGGHMPPGLCESHHTTHGVWVEIVIERGALEYRWLDGSGRCWQLVAGEIGVIPAGLPHRVTPASEDTRFYLRLYRKDVAPASQADRDPPRQTLDLRRLPMRLRDRALSDVFDVLLSGQALTVVDDRDLRALFERFVPPRRLALLWLMQADSPARRVVSVCRREARHAARIGEVLQADHARLDALLDAATARAESGEGGGDALGDLIWGLRRHMAFEEQRLFPLFVASGGTAAPTRVMRDEHVDIEKRLGRLAGAPADVETLAGLRDQLERHNFKEEGVLYPLIDANLDGHHAALVEAFSVGD
ncbi:hemerythrin domain-containing protein [Acidihalobacter prosperus]|uniref:hemerythrin domain-containing protein n=1 Tax=Acidihalobacter prosperus TaxID=160660 RepID=UPI000691DC70|nr:hemerythrin domain-containing protein [Acidihalobacter prosperus]